MASLEELGINIPANNPSMEALINAQFISQTTPPGYEPINNYEQSLIDNQNILNSPAEIGAQGINALYPGIGQDINVGSTSTQTFGAGNVYVPTGDIMATDPMLARRKAIDDAAKQRASEIKPFNFIKPPQITDKRFQEQITSKAESFHNEAWQEAVNKFGPENAATILKDPNSELGRKYQMGLHNLEDLASNFNQHTDLLAQMRTNIDAGKKTYLPETMRYLKDYEGMLGDFENGEVLSSKNLNLQYNKLQGHRAVEDYIQEPGFLKDIQGKISESFRVNDKGEYYDLRTNKKVDFDEPVKQVAKSLAETVFAPAIADGYTTEDFIFKAIKARKPNEQTLTGSINEKSTDAIDRANETNVPSLSANGVFVPYQNTEEGKGVVSIKNWNNTGDVIFRSLADYNMSVLGGKSSIYVRGKDKELSKVDVNTLNLDNIQIFDDSKKVKQIPGSSKVQLGEMSLLDDGTLVQKAKVFRPKTILVDKDGNEIEPFKIVDGKKVVNKGSNIETFEVTDELILLQDNKGEGKSIISAVKSHMGKNTEAIKNYDEAVEKMENIRTKELGSKTSTSNTNKPLSESDFNEEWSKLKKGEKLVGPDGKTYTKS